MAEETVSERLARLLREQEEAKPKWDPALIPEPATSAPPVREADDIDRILDQHDIIDSYARWCGKMVPDPHGKRESIMISCPRPDHTDSHPSAWINLDKQTYFCGACNEGGDKYNIAGLHFGLDPKTHFRELREAMATDLGYIVKRSEGRSYIVEQKPLDNVISIAEKFAQPAEKLPRIDWKTLFPNDTFMRRWMQITSQDDLPDEFYVWLGLTAVGLAAGNDVVLNDNPNVKMNLFLCLYGRSGIGKTRAVRVLSELLRKALPYEENDYTSKGTYLMPSPGSAESLIDSFAKVEIDNVTQARTYHSVRGLVRFDELSTLIGKSSRMGSVLKPTLMELYDSYEPVKMKSRGSGLVVAEKHFCSTITTTQPGAIRLLLVKNDTDSGFVNRWIYCAGPEKRSIAYAREQLNIEPCVSLLQGLLAWSSSGRYFTLQDEALKVWENFFQTELEPCRVLDQADLVTRCDLHLKKIIALFTIDEKLDNPTVEIVERALTLWPYLARSYELVGAEIGQGVFQDAYNDTIEAIKTLEKKNGSAPKRRDITRKIGRKHGADIIVKVLKIMEELGEVELETTRGPSGRGSPIVTYKYID